MVRLLLNRSVVESTKFLNVWNGTFHATYWKDLSFVFKIYIVCTSLPIEPYSAIVRQKACLGCFNVIFILGVKMKKVRRRGVIL